MNREDLIELIDAAMWAAVATYDWSDITEQPVPLADTHPEAASYADMILSAFSKGEA